MLAVSGAISLSSAYAQQDTLYLTLDEAVRMALESSFGIQREELAIRTAEQQVREAWGTVYPQVSGVASYQRNIKTANPFAGTDAGGLFETLGAIEWLAYNESQRLEGGTPITLEEFFRRQGEGFQNAGITPPGSDDNIFGVDNQFVTAISVTQALFNGSAFAAIQGAEQFKQVAVDGYERQVQIVIDQVREAYYRALLAQQTVDVLRASVQRLEKTVRDARRAAEQGVVSRADRLSAEVELVNLETNLIEAENGAQLALQALHFTMGIPIQSKTALVGTLEKVELPEHLPLNPDDAMMYALQHRPDFRQVQGLIAIRDIEARIIRAQYFPVINAFADYSYLGNVPDNRTRILRDPADPFAFQTEDRGFFDSSYWNANFAAGVRLNWTIFNGFQTSARVQQARLGKKEAELNFAQLEQGTRLEIEQAIKNLMAAQRRIQSQERNIERAQLNYEFAQRRRIEGVGTALEERNASQLLDQSRLNYLTAVHDYLLAISKLELAIGKSIPALSERHSENN